MTTTTAIRLELRCDASQATPSTSRWFVGSSSKIRSKSSINSFAKPTLRRSPPERVANLRSKISAECPPNNPVKTSRMPLSLAHSCVALPPRTTSRTVALLSCTSNCESKPSLTAFALVTRPASGDSIPAITFISVLLPEPFRPTIPMRSVSETPSETSARSGRISKAFETSSKLTRFRAIM